MSIHTAISRVAASFAALIFFTSPLLAQDWAREKLEKSPRHGEWVEVKHGDRNVRCFLVFPEVKEKAAAVIVVHEISGSPNGCETSPTNSRKPVTSPSLQTCSAARPTPVLIRRAKPSRNCPIPR